jgi:mannose-6-phosphate isomerase-like protein (cupin superfamily)
MRMKIESAQVVVPCADLARTLGFLTASLDFHVDLVMPADSPTLAVVSGYGLVLRLVQRTGVDIAPITLHLTGEPPAATSDARAATRTVDGLTIEFESTRRLVEIPAGEQRFTITRLEGGEPWSVGRAGMLYRDLIPGRYGGRFIASHIRIPDGGEVPDYPHFHRIRFQMIYCRSGTARLVYEDQGEPFVFTAGDCVLQPPEIRHRVLETSAGFEVIELGCPAVHETHADRSMTLPTAAVRPARDFGGQRFVRHVAATTPWSPWPLAAGEARFSARDTGIAAGTRGIAGAWTVRCTAEATTPTLAHEGELLFLFLLRGRMHIDGPELGRHELADADCCTIPAGAEFRVTGLSGLELLAVALPAAGGVSFRWRGSPSRP